MKVITCCSYYGSGSSAVTDLISEYNGVKSMTNYEFRFAHDPDGLSELEFNLVDNFNRHNSGHALKRYKKLVDYYGNHFMVRRYEPFFQNKWKEVSYDYINKLIDFSYPGYWQYDFYDRGSIYEFIHKLPQRILKKTIWKNKPDKNLKLLNCETYASNPTEEKFLSITREYTNKLMNLANKENYPYLMVDQILPSTNLKRHLRYFDNMKAIIVDRDPRDIYLLAKYEWNDNIVPKDIKIFCEWYKYSRSTKNIEQMNKEVKIIQFEDLIYKYEETKQDLIEWIGLKEKDHIKPFTNFDPKKSIKNTQYWISHPQYKEEAKIIESLLGEYLYDFKEVL